MHRDPSSHSVPKTVLIVEDNQLNLKLFRDVLEFHGYLLLTTGLGEKAIELARERRPDLILMEIQLPDMSGMEWLEQVKNEPGSRSLPIIIYTARDLRQDEEEDQIVRTRVVQGEVQSHDRQTPQSSVPEPNQTEPR